MDLETEVRIIIVDNLCVRRLDVEDRVVKRIVREVGSKTRN